MYFSPKNGIVPTNTPAIFGKIPGQRIKGVSPAQDSYNLNAVVPVQMFNLASVGAGVVSTTLEGTFVLPTRCKIPKINVSFTAINALTGADQLNIVQGTGIYETAAAVFATGTYTLTGVPLTTFNNVYTIGGFVATAPQTTGNSLTVQAAADVIVINAVPGIAALVTATSALGVITITANAPGPGGNSITTVGSSTGGDTNTANQAVLSGGASAAGINVAGNDNSSSFGLCTDPAVDGDALFNIDVPINLANFPNAHTAAVSATGFFTLSGVPTTTFNNIYGFGRLGTVVVAQVTGNTLAVQATADAVAITAAAIGITATASGNQVLVTATVAGAYGNFIATTASTTGGDNVLPGQAFLSGGINTGGSSGLGLIPTYPDAVYPCGAIMTLRLITTAAVGSITNLSVSAVLIPQQLDATTPDQVIGTSLATPLGGSPTVGFPSVDF